MMLVADSINRLPLGSAYQPCVQVAVVVNVKHLLRFHDLS